MNKGKSKKRLQFKHILSIITLVLVGLIIYGAREDFAGAIGYLGDMNIWILLLLIPMQVLMYFAAGKVYFTYLQAKKEGMKISLWKLMRISFEINFANQILPSGGASGIAYIAWRLRSYGITPGQTTMMQIFRYAAVSAATVFQMLVALVVLGITGALSGWIFWISVAITSGLMVGVVVLLLIISRKKRVDWFVQIVSRFINFVIGRLLFWKKERLVLIKPAKLDGFLADLHKEYDGVRKNPRVL
ncbi:lysylphosphatidylglycerol synthase domain-containing protein, partial [Candidatus Saccharibacteria bacterium]|nr:lysylphosphatidylglycerol synthase domain-containing protein [Candidatus Saccharibacteria bacterium]